MPSDTIAALACTVHLLVGHLNADAVPLEIREQLVPGLLIQLVRRERASIALCRELLLDRLLLLNLIKRCCFLATEDGLFGTSVVAFADDTNCL